MIKIANINQAYGSNQVLNNISLEIQEEKNNSTYWRQWSWKINAFRCHCKTHSTKSGDVFIDDVNMKTMKTSDIAKKLAILKQTNHISLKLTIRDLVTFGRYPHSKGRLTQKDKNMIEEALVYMKIKDIEHKYIDELSGGQRQRAYIAMILAQDTKVCSVR